MSFDMYNVLIYPAHDKDFYIKQQCCTHNRRVLALLCCEIMAESFVLYHKWPLLNLIYHNIGLFALRFVTIRHPITRFLLR